MIDSPAIATTRRGSDSKKQQYLSYSRLLTLWLVLAFLWMLLHPYAGMRHDARLYTLQALGHLLPDLYDQDIFLRFGSQDSYTLFTPIYAQLCAWLSIEHAAALLTVISQWLFLAACWLMARRITDAVCATLSLGMIISLPGNYGSDFIFTYFETFLTPRLLAEALTLFALACFISERRTPSAILLLGAFLIHPIMGMAGIVFVCSWLAFKHPKPFVLLSILPLATLPILAFSPLGESLRFDDEWLAIVDARSPSMFIRNWMLADTARLIAPIATLGLCVFLAPTPEQKRIAQAALLTAGGGLLVTWLGADLLRLVLVTQGQAWRWLWLSTVLAVLLLLPLANALWHRNTAGKATVLLLASAWLVRNEVSSLGLVAFALAAGLCSYRQVGNDATWRKLYFGSWAMLALTASWLIAISLLSVGSLTYTYHWPNWIDAWRDLFTDGLIPISMMVITWLALCSRRPWLHALCAAGYLAVLTSFAAFSWQNWTYEEYPAALVQSMEKWRRHIPPGTDVLWMHGPPTPVWLTLQRPSYISRIQTTVTLFSRSAALALKARATGVDAIFPRVKPMVWIGTQEQFQPETYSLNAICARIGASFFVTQAVLDEPPLETAPPNIPPSYRNAKLYQCRKAP